MPKLFLYKAQNADVIAILRRGNSNRKEWQLILWNTANDTFQDGQWLMNKMIHPRYCSISPNGEYFSYHYWMGGRYSEDAGFSKLPNFTAEYYGTWNTYYTDFTFTHDNKGVVSLENQFGKRNPNTQLELVLRKNIDKSNIIECGYIGLKKDNILVTEYSDETNSLSFIDTKGRNIKVKDGIIYLNDMILLDTTNNKFVPVEPIV